MRVLQRARLKVALLRNQVVARVKGKEAAAVVVAAENREDTLEQRKRLKNIGAGAHCKGRRP